MGLIIGLLFIGLGIANMPAPRRMRQSERYTFIKPSYINKKVRSKGYWISYIVGVSLIFFGILIALPYFIITILVLIGLGALMSRLVTYRQSKKQ